MQRQKLMRELAFSRSWTGTYIPPSIMRQVAIQPLLKPKKKRMMKKDRSLKMGSQGPWLEMLHAQNRGQKMNRKRTKVTRILGLWIVRYRGDIPGIARPMKSDVFMRRKCSGMNSVGCSTAG